MSAVIVEQNPQFILPITDRAVVLDRGRIVHAERSDMLAKDSVLERLLSMR